MKKDVISKEILKEIVFSISTYLLNLNIKKIEFLDKEFLRIEKREADIVALIDDSFILHLEIQNNNDSSMLTRMLRYFVDIYETYKKPIKQYLIYIGREKLNMQNSLKLENIDYSYNLIDLKQIDCEIFLKQDNPHSLILAILCDFKEKNLKDVVLYIVEKLKKVTNSFELKKYLLMLEELSHNRDLAKVVKEAEMLSNIRLEDLPSFEIGYEKGIQQGMQEGIKKGIQKSVKVLLDLGLDIQTIAKKLDISVEEIKKILKNEK